MERKGYNKKGGQREKEIEDWKPLEEEWIKVNCNGACNSKEKRAVVGVIARESNKMLSRLGMEIKTEEAEVVEAMAIKHGVNMVIEWE